MLRIIIQQILHNQAGCYMFLISQRKYGPHSLNYQANAEHLFCSGFPPFEEQAVFAIDNIFGAARTIIWHATESTDHYTILAIDNGQHNLLLLRSLQKGYSVIGGKLNTFDKVSIPFGDP